MLNKTDTEFEKPFLDNRLASEYYETQRFQILIGIKKTIAIDLSN